MTTTARAAAQPGGPPNRREQLQSYRERLKGFACLPANKLCADCPEAGPTWASLLCAPGKEGKSQQPLKQLGVLCCYRCSIFHYQMGKEVCRVKNIKMTDEWTHQEIQILEQSGGNQIVNALYESRLNKAVYNKWIVLEDMEEEDEARRQFVHNKYQHLKYFDPALYRAHVQTINSRRTHTYTHTSSHRRSKTAEDLPTMDEASRSKDFVRKPMRRRSQSFQAELPSTDEDGESTDDEQRLSYNLPKHLLSASDNPQRTSQRRSSMPAANGTWTPLRSTPSQRKQRRASMKHHKDTPHNHHNHNPSDEDLEYGQADDMDATKKRSNRRRPSMSNSSRKTSTRRRQSLPSHSYRNETLCQSNAPRMPTRIVSDDSGDDRGSSSNNEYETDDDGFSTPPPNEPSSDPRQRRRLSQGINSNSNLYSPSLPKGTTVDLANSNPKPSMATIPPKYGMDLGYGFACPTQKDINIKNSTPIPSTNLPKPLPSQGLGLRRSHTNPTPSNLLATEDNNGFSSSDEQLGYDTPTTNDSPTKKLPHGRRRRSMRRCSTGGPLDKILFPTQDDDETTIPDIPSLPEEAKKQTQSALRNLLQVASARLPLSSSEEEEQDALLGYNEDSLPIFDAPSSEDDTDHIHTESCLGGFGFDGHYSTGSILQSYEQNSIANNNSSNAYWRGHDSDGSITSFETGLSFEELGYSPAEDLGCCAGSGNQYDHREDEEHACHLASMPRRGSNGVSRRGSCGMGRRRGSMTGTAGRTRRRGSQAGRRASMDCATASMAGEQLPPRTRRRSSVGAGSSHDPLPARRRCSVGGTGTGIAKSQPRSFEMRDLPPLMQSGSDSPIDCTTSQTDGRKDKNNSSDGKDKSDLMQEESPVSVAVVSTISHDRVFQQDDPLAPISTEKDAKLLTLASGGAKKGYWKAKWKQATTKGKKALTPSCA